MPPARKSSRRGPGRPRKSVKKSVRKSSRKGTRKSARKSSRKPVRKSARKSVRKSARKVVRKSARKSARKSTVRRSVGRPRKYALEKGTVETSVEKCERLYKAKLEKIIKNSREPVGNKAFNLQQELNNCRRGLPHNL